VVAILWAGGNFSMAPQADGTVVTWGIYRHLQPAAAWIIKQCGRHCRWQGTTRWFLKSDGTVVAGATMCWQAHRPHWSDRCGRDSPGDVALLSLNRCTVVAWEPVRKGSTMARLRSERFGGGDYRFTRRHLLWR